MKRLLLVLLLSLIGFCACGGKEEVVIPPEGGPMPTGVTKAGTAEKVQSPPSK